MKKQNNKQYENKQINIYIFIASQVGHLKAQNK